MDSEVRKKRNIWITGASSGIGFSLVEQFAAHGDNVIASARDESKLNKLSEHLNSLLLNVDIDLCDVRNDEAVSSTAKRILAKYGTVDILINNAGITCFNDFLSTSLQEYEDVINTNLRGIFLTTKSILPAMAQQRFGIVLNILSFVVKKIFKRSAIYTASKAGADAMMNVVRAEVRHLGIKIVNIYPGAVATPMWHPRQLEKYNSQMLAPNDVASTIYQVSCQQPSSMIEELILRPQNGDLGE
jgi:3-oxoacyl-[acyl-carrier protein] reductase